MEEASKIRFKCINCDKSIKVSAKFAGKPGVCPNCKEVFIVPKSNISGIKSDNVKTKKTIKVNCPYCKTRFEVPRLMMDKSTFCPSCNRSIDVGQNIIKSTTHDSIEPEQHSIIKVDKVRRRSKNCPYCGEDVFEQAEQCSNCGEMLNVVGNPFTSNHSYPSMRNNYAQPMTQNIRITGLSNELEKAVHETKSYVGSAFLTWALYYFGFYIIGLIMNFVFLSQAKQTRDIIDRNPSGINCLKFLIFVNFTIPLILLIMIVILFMTDVLKVSYFENFMNEIMNGYQY
ncbi:MAG: hypothetical protein KAS96_10170 [Planctomycetes bacterium]|nr:hypothetical protein [Planctomycetota bacterium]